MRQTEPVTFTLPLDQILEDRNFAIRIFFGDIDQLAVQLMTEGQLEPLKVRRDGEQFFLVDGHRRRRAFARARQLRIERVGARHVVLEGNRPLREAAGPMQADFDPGRILCCLVESALREGELFASQLTYNCGKPYTLLERMIFLSRLTHLQAGSREDLALKTGFSRTHLANARNLHSADPRLLDYVREGRISQKLALRLLKVFPAEQQIVRVCEAMDDAGRHHRDKLLPKDFQWGGPSGAGRAPAGDEPPVDPVRARLHDLSRRLGDVLRFAPNPVAADRLGTLQRVHRYAMGKLSLSRLEAHLLGRE